MSRQRYPLLAVLTEVASGEQGVRLRTRARFEQLQMLAVTGLVVLMIVGYQLATQQQRVQTWRARIGGLLPRRTKALELHG